MDMSTNYWTSFTGEKNTVTKEMLEVQLT